MLASAALWMGSETWICYAGQKDLIALIDGAVFFEHTLHLRPAERRGWGRLGFICLGDGGWSCNSYLSRYFLYYWMSYVPLGLPCADLSGADWYILVALWMPIGCCSILFIVACRPRFYLRKRKRKRLGLCVKCGYDLRGSRGKCSECGTPAIIDDDARVQPVWIELPDGGAPSQLTPLDKE